MKLIDTHTHLYTEEFNTDRKKTFERAMAEGVEKFFLPAIDSTYTHSMLQTKSMFPHKVFLMAGLHPCSVKENFREELDKVFEFMSRNNFAGFGETGLDFYWDKTFIEEQKISLRQHCNWAIEFKKPLILHTRNSMDDAIAIVQEFACPDLKGIFHCFSGNLEQAEKIIDLGFYLGIGGVLTFKNSGLDKVIKEIDLKHIVLETDSPYLAPVPFRGKRNESAYLKIIAEKLSLVKECTVEHVARLTSENAESVFGNP